MADIIQIRRDLAAEWTTVNPILASGEFGFETDALGLKIGNAVSHWNDLPYILNPNNDLYFGIAGEALGGGKLVYVDAGKVYLYDASNTALADRAIGFTRFAASMDDVIAVQIKGVFTETGMGLTADESYYAALTGLISTNPVQAVCVMVGTAITTDSIKIEIQQSIITA